MKKFFYIFIMAAVFMIAISTSFVFASDDPAAAYVPLYPIADQGGQDCSSPECIKARAAKQHKTAYPAVVVDNPCSKNPCLASIKEDTNAIREWTERSGGEPTLEEMGTDEQTLQHKARKNLKLTKEIHKSVGKAKPKPGMDEKSLHEKIGEPSKEGETILGGINDIKKAVDPKNGWKEWLIIALLFVALTLLGILLGRRTVSANPPPTSEMRAGLRPGEDFEIRNPAPPTEKKE